MALNPIQPNMNPVFQQPLGKKGNFFTGRDAQLASVNRYTPQAQGALSQLISGATQGMANPYEGFQPVEDYARRQFQTQTLPSISERFAGLGSNALSSGAFATQLGQAASDFDLGLAAQRSQYGLQNRGQLLQELLAGITPQFEHIYQPREQGGFESLLGPLLQLLVHGGAAYATGGASLPFTAAFMGGSSTPLLQSLGGK